MKRKLYMFLFTKTRRHLRMLIAFIFIVSAGFGMIHSSFIAKAACSDNAADYIPVTYVSCESSKISGVPKMTDVVIDIDAHEDEVLNYSLNLEFNSGIQSVEENTISRDELIAMAKSYASEWNLDESVICGLIETESQWTVNIIGDNGESYGLMQIQPKWWNEFYIELGCSDWLDAEDNIQTGCAIISYLLYINNGDYYKSLQQYNTGSADTNNGYADKVLSASKKY